jgi:hypothetical protein
MKKYTFLLIVFSGLLIKGLGQSKESKSCNCQFQSILNAGVMEGERGGDFFIQTINGIHYKGWFAGIGVGLDYYRFRSIPLFLDIQKNLLKRNVSPFLYADAGVSMPWRKSNETYFWEPDISKGLYYDIGAGINFANGKKQGLTASLGYSYKFVKETSINPMQCFTFPCPQYKQSRSYDLGRLSLKLGWRISS